MKILFLSHYFPPEVNAPATRTYEHCKEWVRQGHEVTVISCVPHHPVGKAYPGYKNRLFQVEDKDGIKAVKVLTYITANEGFLKRTLNYLFYMLMVIFVAPFIGKADVVVSTSPQFFNGLAGYFVSRIKRAKWVLEIRDLWPESILAVGAITNQRVISALEGIERFVYKRADQIIPVTYAFKEHIVERGGSVNRVKVIRNGVDLELFEPRGTDQAFAQQIGCAGKFVAAYVGTHGMAHGLDVILEAAERLRDESNILFLMIGEGAEKARLKASLESRQLNNVLMLDQMPKNKMPQIWSVTDVSLVLLRKLDLFKTVIPSKIFESMAMHKPIVIGVEGESKDIIIGANAGIAIEPENSLELAQAVKKLYEQSDLAREMGEAGALHVTEHFDRKKLAKQYLDCLIEVIHGDKPSGDIKQKSVPKSVLEQKVG